MAKGAPQAGLSELLLEASIPSRLWDLMHERWDFSFHSTAMKLCPVYLSGTKVLCLLSWQFIPAQPHLPVNCSEDSVPNRTMLYLILSYIWATIFSWIHAFITNNVGIVSLILYLTIAVFKKVKMSTNERKNSQKVPCWRLLREVICLPFGG